MSEADKNPIRFNPLVSFCNIEKPIGLIVNKFVQTRGVKRWGGVSTPIDIHFVYQVRFVVVKLEITASYLTLQIGKQCTSGR